MPVPRAESAWDFCVTFYDSSLLNTFGDSKLQIFLRVALALQIPRTLQRRPSELVNSCRCPRWEWPYAPSELELKVEKEAQALWADLVWGRTDAFAQRTKDLVGKAEFASRAQLLKLSKSFFEPAQAPDARLEGALEMLAAVVQEPAVPAVAGANARASGLDAVLDLRGDGPWLQHRQGDTKLGDVIERVGISRAKRALGDPNGQGRNPDGVWCAVAFAFVVVATLGCPAVVRSCLQMDVRGRVRGGNPLHMPLEFVRQLQAEKEARGEEGAPDLRRSMRPLLHAVWKWWRDRPPVLPVQNWDRWIGNMGAAGLTNQRQVWRGILLEFIIEGVFLCGFAPLVGCVSELRAGLASAAAAVAQGRVKSGKTKVEPTNEDWEACARAYLTLMLVMAAQGWVVKRGRVHYEVTETRNGETKSHTKNLDGAVTRNGRTSLWDYTWFRRHNRQPDDYDKQAKRQACAARFTEMRTAKFEWGFSYADCDGILISLIQYNGAVTMDFRPKPAH